MNTPKNKRKRITKAPGRLAVVTNFPYHESPDAECQRIGRRIAALARRRPTAQPIALRQLACITSDLFQHQLRHRPKQVRS